MYKLAFFYISAIISDAILGSNCIQMPLKLKWKKSAASGCATGETGVVEENISSIKL